jgi:threonine/homoserine/homoserine lactone efflux protein
VGDAIQAAAAAVGLSAVLATSATMFSVVKWAGALYLIVAGIRTLHQRPTPLELVSSGISVRRAFRQGIVVNALNPKTALFFLSIFPQFVDPSAGHVRAQSLVLGALFVLLATVFNSIYSLSASGLRDLLLRGRALPFIRRYVSGAFFLGLGISAAATGHAPSVTR